MSNTTKYQRKAAQLLAIAEAIENADYETVGYIEDQMSDDERFDAEEE